MQAEPGVLVIQSIGLRWDRAGHLAYALAYRLVDGWQGESLMAIDPQYLYIRENIGPMFARGLLDNGVHWHLQEQNSVD